MEEVSGIAVMCLSMAVGIIAVLWFAARGIRGICKCKDASRKLPEVTNMEGTVAMKYVCYQRTSGSAPVIRVPLSELKWVRKTGECELMLQINCDDGYSFAEWVSPQIFDAVSPGTKMTVTYSLNIRTNERGCISLKRHE